MILGGMPTLECVSGLPNFRSFSQPPSKIPASPKAECYVRNLWCTKLNVTFHREVNLSLHFPEFSWWYWGSFTQQRGFELSLGNGFLETTYRLALREHRDGLVRRPAADWSAAKLRSEVLNVTCYLYGLEEVDGKESSDEYAEVCWCLLTFYILISVCIFSILFSIAEKKLCKSRVSLIGDYFLYSCDLNF